MTDTTQDTGAGPTQLPGVALREHDVQLGVSPEQAAAATRSHRSRFLAEVEALSPDEWTAQSRCSAWSVQDVVRHGVHINTVLLDGVAAARAGERFAFFSTFNPKLSPLEYLEAHGPEPVEASLAAYAETTQRLITVVDELVADGADLLVASPVGRQPWHRSVLHGLFDSAIHERDILAPLGRVPDPAPPADELTAIAAYQVLLVGRFLAVVGMPFDLALHLDGGPALRFRVDGPLVSVQPGGTDGAAVEARGEVYAVLDAMVGRGSLADALDAPPEVVAAMSAISSLV
ncbi:MAG TPA: maleylpyruvate isomerase N-terminal domain-containing protein [Mycobacteriales bacterium]|nr:maleylpyruvate isomerase N-terminal domain-containing protein [Mycobacteriales bacterium]